MSHVFLPVGTVGLFRLGLSANVPRGFAAGKPQVSYRVTAFATDVAREEAQPEGWAELAKWRRSLGNRYSYRRDTARAGRPVDGVARVTSRHVGLG